MAEPVQSYQNHARFFPLFHFVAAPILLGNFLLSIWRFYQAPAMGTGWGVIFAFGLVAALLAARLMALTVQDRVIRLEMQMRLARLLTPDLLTRAASLTRGDFVALRFASDAELPQLVSEVCDGQLKTPKEIKLRVKNWQGDFLRA